MSDPKWGEPGGWKTKKAERLAAEARGETVGPAVWPGREKGYKAPPFVKGVLLDVPGVTRNGSPSDTLVT